MTNEDVKRTMKKEILLEKLKGYFNGQEDIRLAFLFGSYAKGRAIKESDLDIALYLREGYAQKRIFDIWNDLEDILKLDVELIILNTDPSTLAWSALRGISVSIKDYRFYLEFMLEVSREAGVLDESLAKELAHLSRTRNVLTHQYIDIKWEMINDFLISGRKRIEEFLQIVRERI